jgi:CheY-like chemotaxis protein
MLTPADSHHRADPALPCILVVEDEPVIRELMAILLEEEGYTVHQACDGLEALETVDQHPVDLVLSDVKMPRLDGASLAHRLRAQPNPLPVILMSAVYAEVDLPGVQFLRKPISGEQLLSSIAASLPPNGRTARGDALDDRESQAPFAG